LKKDLRQLLDELSTSLAVVETRYLYAEIKPQAKQSTSFGKGRAFTPKKKREYLTSLATLLAQSHDGSRLTGEVSVSVLYCFPWRKIDKVQTGWALMDKRPDIDNLHKPLADCLEVIGILSDDAQIVEVIARKIRYEVPNISVKLEKVYKP
jgi:Holliday junction resolvase RusA-like endonuclease